MILAALPLVGALAVAVLAGAALVSAALWWCLPRAPGGGYVAVVPLKSVPLAV